MKIAGLKRRAAGTLALATAIIMASPPQDAVAANSGDVNIKIAVKAPAGESKVRLWAPYPVSDKHQKISMVEVTGNFDKKLVTDIEGGKALYAEWTKPSEGPRTLNMSFRASAVERNAGKPNGSEPSIPEDVKKFTEAGPMIPTDGQIGLISSEAVKDSATILEKHKAVYDWTVQNTFRDPDVVGCGVGVVEMTLAQRGGKCADISTVYVSMARAAGIPAREVFGLRLGKEKGLNDITSGHHCWAEYYQPGVGWTPTDPADVRKMMLVKNLELNEASGYREYYLSSVDENRIAFGSTGRGITLAPPQDAGPLNYFMYPYAEIDGKPVEWLAGQKELQYQISYNRE